MRDGYEHDVVSATFSSLLLLHEIHTLQLCLMTLSVASLSCHDDCAVSSFLRVPSNLWSLFLETTSHVWTLPRLSDIGRGKPTDNKLYGLCGHIWAEGRENLPCHHSECSTNMQRMIQVHLGHLHFPSDSRQFRNRIWNRIKICTPCIVKQLTNLSFNPNKPV